MSDEIMNFQKQIENAVNEQIAEALAQKVLERLEPELAEQRRIVVDELVSHRKSSEQLTDTASQLFKKLGELERKLDEEIVARKSLRDLEKSTLTKLNQLIDKWL